MRDELGNLAIRIEAWQRELHAIQQQHHHKWALEEITQENAQAAIEAARVIAGELHRLADGIELQAEQAGTMLKDDA